MSGADEMRKCSDSGSVAENCNAQAVGGGFDQKRDELCSDFDSSYRKDEGSGSEQGDTGSFGEAVRERPILFSGPMVRAILAGRKTQTRRVVACANSYRDGYGVGPALWGELSLSSPEVFVDDGPSPAGNPGPYLHVPNVDLDRRHRVYPRVRPGEGLWVRETWGTHDQGFDTAEESTFVVYRADHSGPTPKRWRPSIHMPRWASRITLEITEVRVERLHDISEEDSVAEGIEPPRCPACGYSRLDADIHMDHRLCVMPMPMSARESFRELWESINGAGSWDANLWVWVTTFARTSHEGKSLTACAPTTPEGSATPADDGTTATLSDGRASRPREG